MSRTVALILALFIVGVSLHIGWYLSWIEADDRLSGSICCDLSGPVIDLVISERTGYRPPLSLQSLHQQGGMSWLAWSVSEATGFEPDTLLWTQLVALTAGQAALLWAAWPLAGPWGALAAALSLPLIPGIAFGARSWAPFTLQSTLLMLALGCAVRGLHRPRWVILIVAVGYLGATSSRLLTDDLLFLQSLGLMLSFAVLGALWEGRTPRWRTALGAVLTATVLLSAVAWATSERGDLIHHLGYYADELGIRTGVLEPTAAQLAPVWSKEALLAYTWRVSRFELGWVWSALALVAIPGFLLRGRGRAAILAGGLGPLMVLSLVAKKQIFYIYLMLPFVPLLVAVGLIAPLRRRPMAAAVLSGLLVGAAVLGIDTRPPASGSAPARLPRWQHASFQFPYPLTLYPQKRIAGSLDSVAFLAASLPETCPIPIGVLVLDEEIMGALSGEPELGARAAMSLAAAGMCARVYRSLPDDGGTVDVLWVGGGADGGCQVSSDLRWAEAWAEAYQATRWEVVDQRTVGIDGRCRTLLVRSGSRWLETIRERVSE